MRQAGNLVATFRLTTVTCRVTAIMTDDAVSSRRLALARDVLATEADAILNVPPARMRCFCARWTPR